jgi:hypothetical protein
MAFAQIIDLDEARRRRVVHADAPVSNAQPSWCFVYWMPVYWYVG